ncbi:MAG: hypothetical protein LV479_00370 [Methylacidiphilales bacterium]|nr:hypothetical protein [Candidatus Methylacidiphilales bacterium]
MEPGIAGSLNGSDLLFLALTALVAGGTSLAVFLACYYWFRRQQCKARENIFQALIQAGRKPEEFFLSGPEMAASGEVVAQFRVNQGKQVVSVLESCGRRFIHIDGDLPPQERAKMIRYLKSEGFVS